MPGVTAVESVMAFIMPRLAAHAGFRAWGSISSATLAHSLGMTAVVRGPSAAVERRVANVAARDEVNNVLGDVGGVVADTLEILSHQD